jgi:hypothetical protein
VSVVHLERRGCALQAHSLLLQQLRRDRSLPNECRVLLRHAVDLVTARFT